MVVTVIRGLSFDINIAVMEETRVNVENDANDHVDDVAVGEDFDSSQPKARSRKSYTVGFKLAAVDKFDQLGGNFARASRE